MTLYLKWVDNVLYRSDEFHGEVHPSVLEDLEPLADGIIVPPSQAHRFPEEKRILHLNAPTEFRKGDPLTRTLTHTPANVKGIAYTLYVGNINEDIMYAHLRMAEDLARRLKVPLYAFAEPYGAAILKPRSINTLRFCLNKAKNANTVMLPVPKDFDEMHQLDHKRILFAPTIYHSDESLACLARTASSHGHGIVLGKNAWDRSFESLSHIRSMLG